MAQHRLALGQELARRHAIYLDMNYWIWLGKAAAGSGSDVTQELLRALRLGVAAGQLFCPISKTTFFELLRQSDPSSRRSTADLIDQLSLGAMLIDQPQRVQAEISHFFHDMTGRDPLHPLRHLVWSKLCFVAGPIYPRGTGNEMPADLHIQKSYFDYLWSMPLRNLVERLDNDSWFAEDSVEDLAYKLNASNKAHSGDFRAFQDLYEIEVRGISDLVGDIAWDVVVEMARKEGTESMEKNADHAAAIRPYKNLIATSIIDGRGRKPLGTMHVLACLHAGVRWNKSKKFVANDLPDFDHAAAALVYCSAFFTERSLSTLITQNHIALDTLFSCEVFADPQQALECVKQLAASPPPQSLP